MMLLGMALLGLAWLAPEAMAQAEPGLTASPAEQPTQPPKQLATPTGPTGTAATAAAATLPTMPQERVGSPWSWAAWGALALLALAAFGGCCSRLNRLRRAKADQQAALQRSVQQFRGLADSLPDVVVRLDAQGRHLYANPAVQRLCGRPPEACVGKSLADIGLPADLQVAWAAALQQALAEGVSQALAFSLSSPQGLRHWEASLVPEAPAPGQPATVLAISREVTAQRQAVQALQDSEVRARALFEASPVPTLAYAAGSLRLLAVNEAFGQVFGYSRDEALDLRITDLYPPQDRAAIAQMAARVQGFNQVRHIQYLCKDGTPKDVETRSQDYVLDGQPARISVVVDVGEQRRAEADHRAAAERFEKLFQAAPEAISVSELDTGRFFLANDAFCALFGHPRERVIGHTSHELKLWTDASGRDQVLQQLRAGQPVHGHEGVGRRGDGQAVHVLFSAERIEFSGGDALLLMFRDISERKRLETALRASERRFRVAASFGQVWEWDFKGGGIAPSSEFFARLGFGEVLGEAQLPLLLRIVPPDDMQRLREVLQRHLESRDPYHLEFRALDAQGQVHWFETWGQAQFDDAQGQPRYIAGTTFEITERKLAEAQAQRLADELELRVQERTAQLAQSEARLRQVNRELETFTYSVSHDLKAPLRGIDGYSRLLLSDHQSGLDTEGRHFLQHIRQATQHMAALIDDLLTFSRLERREMAMAPVSLADLVHSALAGLRPELAAAGADLQLNLPPGVIVRADAQGLAMALRNLLDNALKFSRGRTPPRIVIEARHTPTGLQLSVRDNGVGFDMKFHDRIFAIFQRLHRAEDYPGTGIGLAIVRKAAERMGGRVWAESRPGQGATFTLELPAADAPEAPPVT